MRYIFGKSIALGLNQIVVIVVICALIRVWINVEEKRLRAISSLILNGILAFERERKLFWLGWLFLRYGERWTERGDGDVGTAIHLGDDGGRKERESLGSDANKG